MSVRAAVEAVGAARLRSRRSRRRRWAGSSRWLEREIRVLAMLAAGIDPGWIARSERCRRETVEAIRERAREREAEGVAAACRGAQSAESRRGRAWRRQAVRLADVSACGADVAVAPVGGVQLAAAGRVFDGRGGVGGVQGFAGALVQGDPLRRGQEVAFDAS